MRAVRVLLLAGAAVAATALPLPLPLQTSFAPSRVAAAGECVDGWRSMDLPPKTFPNSLFETIAWGRTRVAAGGSHSSGFLAFRWHDGSWVDAAVPSGGTRGLTGGVSTSATGLTAVGYIGAGDHIAAGRIRGGGWDAASVDAASRGASTFSDAAASRGTVWAVGSRATGGRMRALAMRLHRGRWDRQDPSIGGAESALTAISATPNGAVWAVGWRTVPGGWLRPVIVRRTDKGWKKVPVTLPIGNAVLTDIHLASGDVGWAVGYLVRRGESRHEAVLLERNGAEWQRQALPWADDRSIVLRGVGLDGSGTLWLAGTRLAAADREVRGFVAQRRPADWVLHDLDVPADLPSEMRSIAGIENGALAAGSVGSTSLAIMSCGPGIARAARRVTVGGLRARRRAGIAADDERAERGPGANRPRDSRRRRAEPACPIRWHLRDSTSVTSRRKSGSRRRRRPGAGSWRI